LVEIGGDHGDQEIATGENKLVKPYSPMNWAIMTLVIQRGVVKKDDHKGIRWEGRWRKIPVS